MATVVSFAMFGLIFTAPQYFQAVLGTDPLGAGIRLLPLVAGLLAGGVAAGQLARLAGAKITVASGFALIAAMDAAIGQLSAERSGVGSALITAVRTVGGTFGVAVLGSILNSAYRARLPLPGVPAPAADGIRNSVMAGAAAAHKLGSLPLPDLWRAAFVHGMDAVLWGAAASAWQACCWP